MCAVLSFNRCDNLHRLAGGELRVIYLLRLLQIFDIIQEDYGSLGVLKQTERTYIIQKGTGDFMKSDKKMYLVIVLMFIVFAGVAGFCFAWNVKTTKQKETQVSSETGNKDTEGEEAQASAGTGTDDTARSDEAGSEQETKPQEETSLPDETSPSDDQKPQDNRPVSDNTGHTVVGSIEGDGYEGTEGTGKYNYGEALQKSLLFYELQRSGKLPEVVRCNWRGDSCLNDGSDASLDLTGGWFDAGDHVKFNLPMSYSAAMLGWSIYEDYDAYKESGQLEYALSNIKWANDYFIKCHPEDEVYYYQVGNGSSDHSWWGPAEVLENKMSRPSYCVTSDAPGSAVTAETAASLAICSMLFKDTDSEYSKTCLEHAKSLYAFADKYKSDAGYTQADGFYNSWSGYYDELSWAGVWLYLASEDDSYLKKAEEYYPQAGQDYNWSMCWDDVHIGAALMLAKLTDKDIYKDAIEKHLDYWTTGTADGERITYTPKGLAWLDNWGSLRYATTTAYLAAVYSEWEGCPASKSSTYFDFAVSQADYALGDTGFSYLIGFGDSYPKNPHHRTAQGSYADNMNEPSSARHTLIGALVGGPDASDGYRDEVSNYNNNEVACDYNAGFTGLLAKLYGKYHGKTIKNLGAVETPASDEISADAGINVLGDDFVEIKAYVYNKSAWPARAPKRVELRYFVDLSEIYEAGGSAADVEITTNYMQDASSDGLKIWDEDNHIYYLSVIFDGKSLYPGGQQFYKKEVQVRMKSRLGVWDNSNDPSYEGLTNGSMIPAVKLAVYEGDKLSYGTEPKKGANAGQSVSGQPSDVTKPADDKPSGAVTGGTAKNGDFSVSIEYSGAASSANSIAGLLSITNVSSKDVSLDGTAIRYYFTNEEAGELNFSCYHAAINGADGSYTALSEVKGEFEKCQGDDADTACVMSFPAGTALDAGGTLTINFSINKTDWSDFNLSNDYSAKDVKNIVIENGEVLFGSKP